MAFLEERTPIDIQYGATYGDDYAVEITQTADGSEYRRLLHPYPKRVFTVSYAKESATLYASLLNIYHRAFGRFAGFRAKALDDFSTNGETGTPTAMDQEMAYVSSGIYQLQKEYGTDGTALSIGRPVRTIFKPVAGSVKVAINSVEQMSGWTVNTTTGRVTFSSPPSISATVTAGCEFDIPVRFDATLTIQQNIPLHRDVGDIILVELLNP